MEWVLVEGFQTTHDEDFTVIQRVPNERPLDDVVAVSRAQLRYQLSTHFDVQHSKTIEVLSKKMAKQNPKHLSSLISHSNSRRQRQSLRTQRQRTTPRTAGRQSRFMSKRSTTYR